MIIFLHFLHISLKHEIGGEQLRMIDTIDGLQTIGLWTRLNILCLILMDADVVSVLFGFVFCVLCLGLVFCFVFAYLVRDIF